jgi:hypothetical protein
MVPDGLASFFLSINKQENRHVFGRVSDRSGTIPKHYKPTIRSHQPLLKNPGQRFLMRD